MADYWPLLVADPIDGDQLVSSQLRPGGGALLVDHRDYSAACRAVTDLCGTWGGAGMPLIPVTPGSAIDPRWSRTLLESNIDGVQHTDLLAKDEIDKYSDLSGPSVAQLIRIVADLQEKPVVQTCREISHEDPWHLAYLSVIGNLSPYPHPQNTWNDLRENLTFDDVLTIRGIQHPGSAAGLLQLLRDFSTVSAVELSREKLPTGLQGGYNSGLPTSSRFQWSADLVAQRYGPNIVVVYKPGSVEDLSLIWNLRARFLHARLLPLAVPMSETLESDLEFLIDSGVAKYFGFGHHMALTSFSVERDRLADVGESRQFDVVDPWDVLRPIGGYCVASTSVARFTAGKASLPSFSPSDFQIIGGSYLGSHQGTWMKRKSVLVDNPLPPSQTMRRAVYHGDSHYLEGPITSGGRSDGFTTIRMPSGLEVLAALAQDRQLRLSESAPGKAAEHLIRAAGPRLSMLAAPGVVAALKELTRGRHVSMVRRRLNDFLSDPEYDESSERYQLLFDRLNQSVGEPDSAEIGYLKFDRLRSLLRVTPSAAAQWLRWAMASGLVLRGVEAGCERCGLKQWRPLAEAIPDLVCHGCGQAIPNPHGFNHIEYRYLASEILLRAMSHDVLPCVLSMRYISAVMGGPSTVFGGYPGVEFRSHTESRVESEADVLVILRNGSLILGECKSSARGLNQVELEKLWAAADRLGATTTFVATLDRAENCRSEWKYTQAPNGRPHFALTAEHLFDLGCMGPAFGEDLFEWRDDYHQGHFRDDAMSSEQRQRRLDDDFSDYAERTGRDFDQHVRAPWTRSPAD